MIRSFLTIFILTAGLVRADGDMPGDARFDTTALNEILVGQTLTFYDNGTSFFGRDGTYSYTYFQGDSAHGDYTVNADSSVCIAFQNGFSRCDVYVMNKDRLIMIAADGARFPIKNVTTP